MKVIFNVKNYIKLMRVKHYVKNLLIFFPLVFSKKLFTGSFFHVLLASAAFSLICSAVYIINDIHDIDKDRQHEIKRNRPLASGAISVFQAWIFLIFVVIAAILLGIISFGSMLAPWIILSLYFVLNIAYSFGLKNYPIVDVAILVSGFLLRVLYGGEIISVSVSSWLYLTVMSLAFYLSLAKRRGELKKQPTGNTRTVLKYYTHDFLDKNMTVFLSLALASYSLWSIIEFDSQIMMFTIPLVFLIVLRYSMIVEGESHGDPVDVVLFDPPILVLLSIYVISVFLILYIM